MSLRQALDNAQYNSRPHFSNADHKLSTALEADMNAKAARGERQTQKESYHRNSSISDNFDATDFGMGLIVFTGGVFLLIAGLAIF